MQKKVFQLLVDNTSGVLSRISGLFSRRGYNIESITAGVTIYNLFDEEYENNGYAGSGYYTDADGTRHRYNYAGYAAQARIHFMGHVNIEL